MSMDFLKPILKKAGRVLPYQSVNPNPSLCTPTSRPNPMPQPHTPNYGPVSYYYSYHPLSYVIIVAPAVIG